MTPTDIEQIVAEVVRRLMQALPADATFVPSEPEQVKQPTSSLASLGGTSGMPLEFARTKRSKPASADVLTSDERVLSLATVEGKLEGLRRLVVHRKAIVTPALREELSRRGIELDRGGLKGNRTAETSVAAIAFDAPRMPPLTGLGLADEKTCKSLADLAASVAESLSKKGRAVLVLTKQTLACACVLNRKTSTRAAIANNVDSVRTAAKAIAANVILVDPSALGRVQLAAIVRAMENEGGRSVPREVEGLKSGRVEE